MALRVSGLGVAPLTRVKGTKDDRPEFNRFKLANVTAPELESLTFKFAAAP